MPEPLDPRLAERLLDGDPGLAAEDPQVRALTWLLRAARGPATDGELDGQTATVQRFLDARGVRPTGRVARLRQRLTRPAVLTGAGVLTAFGGFTAAAYANVLPAAVQSAAHAALGAPAPTSHHHPSAAHASTSTHPAATRSPGPVGPSASGPAAYGLCTAWRAGGVTPGSIAYRNLQAAAGSGGISAYCSHVAHPTPAATGRPSSSAKPNRPHPTPTHTGKPATPHVVVHRHPTPGPTPRPGS